MPSASMSASRTSRSTAPAAQRGFVDASIGTPQPGPAVGPLPVDAFGAHVGGPDGEVDGAGGAARVRRRVDRHAAAGAVLARVQLPLDLGDPPPRRLAGSDPARAQLGELRPRPD